MVLSGSCRDCREEVTGAHTNSCGGGKRTPPIAARSACVLWLGGYGSCGCGGHVTAIGVLSHWGHWESLGARGVFLFFSNCGLWLCVCVFFFRRKLCYFKINNCLHLSRVASEMVWLKCPGISLTFKEGIPVNLRANRKKIIISLSYSMCYEMWFMRSAREDLFLREKN